MSAPASSITPAIVESLYAEALQLAEDARTAFETAGVMARQGSAHADAVKLAFSGEALRTTTRMMHALAWLLNHRAFFAGDLSALQLRRHGRLPAAQPATQAAELAKLDQRTLQVVDRSRAFYARLERLDHAWRTEAEADAHPLHDLPERLGQALRH